MRNQQQFLEDIRVEMPHWTGCDHCARDYQWDKTKPGGWGYKDKRDGKCYCCLECADREWYSIENSYLFNCWHYEVDMRNYNNGD